MAVKRKFKGTSAEMLIVAASIVQAAMLHLAALVAKRPIWANPFFPDFEARINTIISTYLGVDNAAALRQQTAAVNSIFDTSKDNVSDMKLQIEQDYKDDKPRMKEILTTLGYKLYWDQAQGSDQEGLINLLLAFKQNLTVELRNELIAKGSLPAMLTQITDAGQTLLNANVTQESLKQSKKGATDTAIIAFNKIYDDTITVCKLATRYLKNEPSARDQFSYSKALAALSSSNLSVKYDDILIIQPGTLLTVSAVKLTKRSRIILTLLYDLDGVYACRNTNGCYPSTSRKLQFEVPIELTKADLEGLGDYLIISNPLAENAKVQIKIMG